MLGVGQIGDDVSDGMKPKDIVESVRGLVEAVPIYEDAVRPAVRELGKGLETIAKAINVALLPVSGLIWGYEHVKAFVETRVAEKLATTPAERIQPPSPLVVGPALEALRFAGHIEPLREMYANLLATSLDRDTASTAHPAFVGIIREMTPDEARILRLFVTRGSFPFVNLETTDKQSGSSSMVVKYHSHMPAEAGAEHPELGPMCVDNLRRLGLVEVVDDAWLTAPNTYEPLEHDPALADAIRAVEANELRKADFVRGIVRITELGKLFIGACLVDRSAAQ